MAEFERSQLRQWALRGAEQRLLEIATEAAAIHRAFPELRDRQPAATAARTGARGATPRTRAQGNRGRHMRNAAARQAARDRMLKFWAAKRKSTGGRAKKQKPASAPRGSRKMSAAGRRRISEAQKQRWAKRRAGRR